MVKIQQVARTQLMVVVLAAATITCPLLNARAAEAFGPSAYDAGARRSHQQQVLKRPIQLVDCERIITQDSQSEDTERCFAIIEAALRSTYGLDLIRYIIENAAAAAASGQQKSWRHPAVTTVSSHKARRASGATNHRAPGFVQDTLGADALKGQSGEALSKLLMNGLGENANSPYGEEFSMLDGGDKPLWPGAMSGELQSRWQPMRGKRS